MGSAPGYSELSSWAAWAASNNDKARARRRWRSLAALDGQGPLSILGDKQLTCFASNDYLGLSSHPTVVAAAKEAIDRWGTGAGASRLVSGTRPVHGQLEAQLAAWKKAESALVFASGFATNVGVLSTLARPGVLICTDALNHASIIDGCRLAGALGARVEVYPHLALDRLQELLAGHSGRAVVVSDSVFSMDGDGAPVDELAQLCGHYGALLVLDEAHGVLGPHLREPPCELLRTGTLSKTLGSLGGFVAGRRAFTDLFVNRSRPFIYSTALSPADSAAALAALGVLRSSQGELLVQRLAGHVARLAPGTGPRSPIIPIVLGKEEDALIASQALGERGFLVPAIRPPTVPPGTSRLRVSLSAAHSDQDVAGLLTCLGELGLTPLP